jgi:hypothetical protein
MLSTSSRVLPILRYAILNGLGKGLLILKVWYLPQTYQVTAPESGNYFSEDLVG